MGLVAAVESEATCERTAHSSEKGRTSVFLKAGKLAAKGGKKMLLNQIEKVVLIIYRNRP